MLYHHITALCILNLMLLSVLFLFSSMRPYFIINFMICLSHAPFIAIISYSLQSHSYL